MRQWNRVVIVTMAALAVAAGAAGQASGPSVDDLLARHFAARGGLDKLKAMTTLRMSGKVEAGGQQIEMLTVSKRPNLMRQEQTVMGRRIISAFDGTRMWVINPMTGSSTPQTVPAQQAQAMRDQADFDGPLVDYRAKGNEIEYAGTDSVEGRKTIKLKVTIKGGGSMMLDIDAESYLDARITREIDMGGTSAKVETLLSDFRVVSGLTMPHTIRTLFNGQPQALTVFKTIEINVAVDDSLFQMPSKQ